MASWELWWRKLTGKGGRKGSEAASGHPLRNVHVISCMHDLQGWEFISQPQE